MRAAIAAIGEANRVVIVATRLFFMLANFGLPFKR